MFYHRSIGRTLLSGKPAIDPTTMRASGRESTIPESAITMTTATITKHGPTAGFYGFFDAGNGNQFDIDGLAVARANQISNLYLVVSDTLPEQSIINNPQLVLTRKTIVRGTAIKILETPLRGRYLYVGVFGATDHGLGFIWLGKWLKVPLGLAPPFVQPNKSAVFATTQINNRVGEVLGVRAQPTISSTNISFRDFPNSFFDNFDDLRVHLAMGLPSFLVPDRSTPDNFGLIQVPKMGAPQYTNPNNASLSFTANYIPL